jgi:peptidoglycan/xylan/chitin deacetylase (PgdA/CDA1 family)
MKLRHPKNSSMIVATACGVLLSMACNNNNSNQLQKDSAVITKATEPKKNTIDTAVQDTSNRTIVYQPITYDTTKQYIYLTFDDGPQGGTKQCLELCKKLGVKATFFMVGRHGNDKQGKAQVKIIRSQYPQILMANHSYTHANEKYQYFYQHPSMAEQDFYKAQDSLNVPFKIIRLPGNSAWVRRNEIKSSGLVRAVCNKLDSAGYNVMGWDVEWRFTRGKSFPVESPAQMATQVDTALYKHTHTPNHVVILTHDRMFRMPNYTDSLQKFITILKQNPKYVFETMDHYPGLKM